MSEMVERVAAVLRTYDVSGTVSRVLARAAIEAMREPTEAALSAGIGVQLLRSDVAHLGSDWAQRHWMGQSYRAMIDAALKDAP